MSNPIISLDEGFVAYHGAGNIVWADNEGTSRVVTREAIEKHMLFWGQRFISTHPAYEGEKCVGYARRVSGARGVVVFLFS